MTALLATAAAAVMAGAKSLVAIGEWVADAPQHILAQLGFGADPLTGVIRPPHAGTIRLMLLAVDGDALDNAIGRYLQERRPVPETAAAVRRAIAVDRQDTARLPHPRQSRDRAAGRDGPHRQRPGPAAGRRQEQRDPRLRPAARNPRPGTDPDHRRCPAHPARARRLPA
ncbi:transposase family protein [Streptomyces avermitilis]|uniref:transposase family protein n=1 Tax=Streptomyces avermitilis TaxID=33903 RepID=UPI00339E809D